MRAIHEVASIPEVANKDHSRGELTILQAGTMQKACKLDILTPHSLRSRAIGSPGVEQRSKAISPKSL